MKDKMICRKCGANFLSGRQPDDQSCPACGSIDILPFLMKAVFTPEKKEKDPEAIPGGNPFYKENPY